MTVSRQHDDEPQWTAYVLDELSAAERQALEQRLANDPAARREIQTLRDTIALVFAALQSESVGELTAEQRQRIRAAARRQLNSVTLASPHSTPSSARPVRVSRRATRGAVLLASLAMVAVTLVVVSAVPDASRTSPVALVDREGGNSQPGNYLVYISDGRDLNGAEHFNVVNYFGDLDGRALRTDGASGMQFIDAPALGEQPTQRFYVTPASPIGVPSNGSVASVSAAEMFFVPPPETGMTNLWRWDEQRSLDAMADSLPPDTAALSADVSRGVQHEGLERSRGWFVTRYGEYSGNGAVPGTSFGIVPLVEQPSTMPSSEAQGHGGATGSRDSYFRAATPSDGSSGQSQSSPGGVPAAPDAAARRSLLMEQLRSLSANRESLSRHANESELKAHYDHLAQQVQERSIQRRVAEGQLGAGGHPVGPVRAQLEQAGTALDPEVESAPKARVSPQLSAADASVAASSERTRESLDDLSKSTEQDLSLQHEFVDGIPAQQLSETGQAEGAAWSYFYFEHNPPTVRMLAVRDEQLESRAVTFEKSLADKELSRLSDESYARIVEHDFTSTLDAPLSTFSVDTDNASYSNVRRFLDNGQWPAADAVRLEELVNYFPYDYAEPTDECPVAVTVEASSCPWQPNHRLARIALKAQEIDDSRRPPTSLVFLVDVSGSMQDENKLPLARQSLRMLAGQLTENDRIALVTYADEARQVLDSTTGDHRDVILAAVDALSAGGSTNGAGGLTVAYDVARRHYIANGTNRVILCSDGDFNVGISDDDELVRLIEEQRKSGVFLSIFGFGTGNIKDAKLEKLADHGNGQYFYVDSLDEARKAFVEQLMGTLYTVAKDVKLQVDFNALHVASYRLVGYENRDLSTPDFDNDTVDAGELGSGHTVTALYEYVPRTISGPDEAARLNEAVNQRSVRFGAVADGGVEVRRRKDAVTIDGEVFSEQRKEEIGQAVQAVFGSTADRRYAVDNRLKVVARAEAEGGRVPFNDTLTVRLRYKRPAADESTRLDVSLIDAGHQAAPSADFEWAAAVAAFGLLLRQSRYQELANFDAVLETAQAAKGADPTGRRREFIDLVRQARSLWSSQSGIREPDPVALSSAEAYQKAAVAGKYTNLLDKVAAPDDLGRYGAFHEYGRWEGTDYHGRNGLPPGYWVYVYPDWFIWGSQSAEPAAASSVAP